jgi:hypothetical protein
MPSRSDLARDVIEFLLAGGTIEQLPPTARAHDEEWFSHRDTWFDSYPTTIRLMREDKLRALRWREYYAASIMPPSNDPPVVENLRGTGYEALVDAPTGD